jgi:hypothetical protein
VELDAGDLPESASALFGTGARSFGPVQTSGTEVRLAFASALISADVGTTPLGFPVQAVVGGVRLTPSLGALHLAAQAARRSVVDSVLSYAGMKDPGTGRYWGGVVQEGGRLDASIGGGVPTLWAFGSVDRLVGFRVEDNRRVAGGAGLNLIAHLGGAGDLGAGVDALAQRYDENLRYFTFGHGGYFSPQRFLHAGLPLSWKGGGAFRWEAAAEPAYHAFTEAEAPRFPLGGGKGSPYPGQTKQGFALDARALLGLRLGAVDASLTAGLQEAPEFQEARAGFVLRYLVR